MTSYFDRITTLQELRSQYKALLKKYHPDNADGSLEVTKVINLEYEQLFQQLKNAHTATGNATAYSEMQYDFSEDEKLREILNKVVTLAGLNIEIIGNWIWLDGLTYPHRKYLSEIGFKWASEKKKWYFHTEIFRKKSRKKLSLDDIRQYYGSTSVRQETGHLLQA